MKTHKRYLPSNDSGVYEKKITIVWQNQQNFDIIVNLFLRLHSKDIILWVLTTLLFKYVLNKLMTIINEAIKSLLSCVGKISVFCVQVARCWCWSIVFCYCLKGFLFNKFCFTVFNLGATSWYKKLLPNSPSKKKKKKEEMDKVMVLLFRV